MKKGFIIAISLVVIVLIIGVFYYTKVQNDKKLLESVQGKIIFFYGDGCPHCANVETFFQDNDVESKIQLEKKEVYNNSKNVYLMTLVATKKCNLLGNKLGVPFLWDGQNSKCLMGDQSIIDFFKDKLGI